MCYTRSNLADTAAKCRTRVPSQKTVTYTDEMSFGSDVRGAGSTTRGR